MNLNTISSAVLLSSLMLCLTAGCGKVAPVNTQRPGAESADAMPVGSSCTVHFRRDALGAATGNPIPIRSSNHNGADITLSGNIVSQNDDWLVIDLVGHQHCWIPMSAVLYVTVQTPPAEHGEAPVKHGEAPHGH